MCGPQSTTADCLQETATAQLPVESTNRLDRKRGWEAESSMRVASLESVLTAATLVTAIVVVLWALKMFHGA